MVLYWRNVKCDVNTQEVGSGFQFIEFRNWNEGRRDLVYYRIRTKIFYFIVTR